MGYCFDCIARSIGFKNQIEMFKNFLDKKCPPQKIAQEIGVDYHTALRQMQKLELIEKSSWGGPRIKRTINLLPKDQSPSFLKAR